MAREPVQQKMITMRTLQYSKYFDGEPLKQQYNVHNKFIMNYEHLIN
jgi:hypothetical protein